MFRNRAFPILAALTIAAAAGASADTVSLAWDPVSHPTLSGYRVYYGTAAGNYTQTLDVGTTPNAVLTGLASCTDYHIAVKAVATDGQESSLFSNEVVGWARPIVGSASPASLERGATVDVTLTGANFRSGVAVTTSNPGLTVNGVSVGGCNSLVVNLTVAPGAALGAVDFTVTDPFGIVGTGAALASVTADATAPAVSGLQAAAVGSTTADIVWTTDEPADGRVFYRETSDSFYQQTALAAAAVTSHSITLTGLTPGAQYEYYVESTDAAGNTATANGPAAFSTSTNGFTYLRFEAENGPVAPPAETATGSDAFGNAWMQLQQGAQSGSPASPSGTWDYGFALPSAGTWHVWVRVYGVNANANAWLESVDGASFAVVEPSGNGAWEWVEARSWTLAAGQHTFSLGGAEARARIDRVLITNDPAFQPSEQPGGDLTPTAAPGALAASEDDGQVALSWTNPSDGDLDRIVVRFRDDGTTPTSPVDGQAVIDRPAVPGASDGVTHGGLVNDVTLSYAVFAIDAAGNVSAAAAIDATPQVQQGPPPAQVQNLIRTDTQ